MADRLRLEDCLNERCPWSGDPVSEDSLTLYRGEVVGFVCAFRNADPQWGSLVDNLHAAPHMRGHGLGERLLRSAVASLARGGAEGGVHLWVFEANTAGLRFYERLGGRVVGQTVSKMATAPGQVSLRVHWPTLQALAGA